MESRDWNLCIICGEGNGELRCPADSLQNNGIEVYTNFLELVEKFRQLNGLPVDVSFEGGNIAQAFLRNKAKYHKTCHLKFAQSKLTRVLEQRKRSRECSPSLEGDHKRLARSVPDEKACIFCSKKSGTLHLCSTMRLDHELGKMAEEQQDTSLMAKIAGCDLVAIDAKYHNNCLLSYKNKYRSLVRSKSSLHSGSEDKPLIARAFAELVSYIENDVENGNYIFKLSLLHSLYVDHFCSLVEKSINKTRLKKKLLEHFSVECQEQSDGKNTLLVISNEGLQMMLKESVIAVILILKLFQWPN